MDRCSRKCSEQVQPFLILRLIIFLMCLRVYRDANTIFRGNTLVSKMMDEVMRLAGLHYLHETLRPALEQVFSERKPCEIDPARVKDSAAIQTNMENLKVECSLKKWYLILKYPLLQNHFQIHVQYTLHRN